MKAAQLLICLLAIGTSCQEQDVTSRTNKNKWTISWEFDNQVTYGSLYFQKNTVRIVVNEPDALFFNQPEDVVFNWSIENNTFYFTRPDNGFIIAYNIIEQQDSYYKLKLNNEVIVKIFR